MAALEGTVMTIKRANHPWQVMLIAMMFCAGMAKAGSSIYAGVAGAKLIDSGVTVVEDEGRFARVEGF